MTRAHRIASLALLVSLALPMLSCGEDEAKPLGVDIDAEDPPELLSEMNLFSWDGERFEYAEGVYPYELASPLFSDYAVKHRAIYVPEGKQATFDDNQVLEFPPGTVILKHFLFPADFREPDQDLRLIETRVLVRYEDEWKAFPYVWDAEGTDAELKVAGDFQAIDFIDHDGTTQTAQYLVPQKNQCTDCHELKVDESEAADTYVTPIGPKARHLNLDHDYGDGPVNQLQYLADQGVVGDLPAMNEIDRSVHFDDDVDIDAVEPAVLEEMARDYLDINCAHCHNPRGVNGVSSQLFLNHDNTDEFNLGFCKNPGSAGKGTGGFVYDILPGNAAESILVHRMRTEDVGSMMPDIGRSLRHAQGVDMVSAWIDALEPVDCDNSGG